MRRRVSTVASAQAVTSLLSLKQSFSRSIPRPQLQHPQLLTKTHGYGLVRHDTIQTSKDANTAAAADLVPTPVDKGLGTSSSDPYTRTLPNLETRPPETSTILRGSNSRVTVDEAKTIAQRRGTVSYWLGGEFPRLSVYLESLKTTDTLRASSRLADLLQEFRALELPKLCSECEPPQDTAFIDASWVSLVKSFDTLPRSFALRSPAAFTDALDNLTRSAMKLFGPSVAPPESLVKAVEMLRRQSSALRNETIDAIKQNCLRSSALLGDGDAIWSALFEGVRSSLASGERVFEVTDSALQHVWDNLVEGIGAKDLAPPLISAPVALFFYVFAFARASETATGQRIDRCSDTRQEGEKTSSRSFLSVPINTRRTVVSKLLEGGELFSLPAWRVALSTVGLSEDAKQVAIITAARKVGEDLSEKKASELVHLLRDAAQVNLIVARISGNAKEKDEAFDAIRRIFSEHGLRSLDLTAEIWKVVHPSLGKSLLKNSAVRAAMFRVVQTELRAAQAAAPDCVLSPQGAQALETAHNELSAYSARVQEHVKSAIASLASYENVDRTIEALLLLPENTVDLTELTAAANTAKRHAAQLLTASAAAAPFLHPSPLFVQVLESVCARHPNWVVAGVVDAFETAADATSLAALRIAVRIYVRSVYVPHAAAAMLARNTRRRIGPVGLESHQFNMPVEVGQTERYDNLLHKRYDWQGWYQRMVDIHNRNISIRFKLHELRATLDSSGKPFFDMHSERRLRIVAQDRVGMGIVKLDSDKYEDRSDNYVHGSTKLSQLVADARKAMLGPEYIPSVEVKVRRPSGQSKMLYSTLDYDRVEKKSAELYATYRDIKKKAFFVTPMDLWLDVKGLQTRSKSDVADEHGYTVDSLLEQQGQPQK